MARVGILTFHNGLNYGAVLQCFALYKVLEELGHSPIVIDYRNRLITVSEHQGFLITHPKSVARYLRSRSRARSFSEFMSTLDFSERCGRDNIASACSSLDFIVVGSDQVWNPRLTGCDPTYFLDFIDDPGKKMSYAASIGEASLSGCGFDARALLEDFKELLVRERSGVEQINSLLDSGQVTPKAVLDPTLLLHPHQWAEQAAPPRKLPEPGYTLIYVANEREAIAPAANAFAAEHGCSLAELPSSCWKPLPGANAEWFSRDASPRHFLWLFQNTANAIVSSFHGVCFSIINHLDFYYSLPAGSGPGGRIEDLLARLDIRKRSVQDYLSGRTEPLDWPSIDHRLDMLRRESLETLASSLA